MKLVNLVIDNLRFHTLQQPFYKMLFLMKIVTDITFK